MTSESKSRDVAKELMARKKESHDWMNNNFYDQWKEVYRSYKCEREPEKDPNDETGKKVDLSQTSIGMPDTWSYVRRQVARITAQPPNLRFRAKDRALADRISMKCMRDWDRGGVQRIQKKHVTQASLFGWSVRAWSWECLEYNRNKRIDPMGELDLDTDREVKSQYADAISEIQAEAAEQYGEPMDQQALMAELVARKGRGRLLPIQYSYRKYEGPKADFLFVGDCFPEPNFQSIQSSRWFIARRRRSLSWLRRVSSLYPDLKEGLQRLIEAAPNGHDPNGNANRDENDFRRALLSVVDRSDPTTDLGKEGGETMWTIYECHTPGADAKLSYVAEGNVFIGEIPYPYDLDGKIAFTELVLIDDLLCGIGDSHARILRGLQQLHDRQVNVRFDLIHNILRPLIGTSNQELYDNPELLKKGPGYRLVKAHGQSDLWVIGEQAAIASAAAGLQDESSIQRLIQQATGENNMSMAAGVDPQQGRTATGARLMAYNQDILSLDMNAMFTYTSLNADAEMLYMLNRSEMPEGIEFDAAMYRRNYEQRPGQPGDQASEEYMDVTPQDFQIDGEIEAVAGSTIADDDFDKQQSADSLFSAATANPQLFNVEKARDAFLIARGKGRELQEWIAAPQPPPPQEKPKMSISVKLETFPPEIQQQILSQAGLQITLVPEIPPAPEEMAPEAPGGPPPPPRPFMVPPQQQGGQNQAAPGLPNGGAVASLNKRAA